MRYSKLFADYELLDCGEKERLERWGDIFLIRPDPQAIWKKDSSIFYWENSHAKYMRSDKGGGKWEIFKSIPNSWNVSYRDLIFKVQLMGFKHTGVFPEQSTNWDLLRETIRKSNRKIKMLNLFGYTGISSVAALKEGAEVVHVDASRGMIETAKQNISLSGVTDEKIKFYTDDCFKLVEREIRRGNRYDIIIMDPPSYGRGPKGEIWQFEEGIFRFLEKCAGLLSEDALMLMVNSYTNGISPGTVEFILNSILCKTHGGDVSSDEIGIPVKNTDRILPCGSTAIWKR